MDDEQKVKAEVKQEENQEVSNTLMCMKENLYDRLNVSLKTMNMVIALLVIAIIVFTTFGIWQAHIK
ncbi:MAG: hypothetical protein H9893_14390 [Candidatus Niameybacter stercoravium]|nr:hypothetical protein [Candidatus Niameybacter stercoravium]